VPSSKAWFHASIEYRWMALYCLGITRLKHRFVGDGWVDGWVLGEFGRECGIARRSRERSLRLIFQCRKRFAMLPSPDFGVGDAEFLGK
jgi:hypothetical protein